MAYTVVTADKTVFGNSRVHQLVVTADAATGTIDTGMDVLTGAHLTAKSAASTTINLKINELAASTASAGSIAITGATSGDDFYLTVFGR